MMKHTGVGGFKYYTGIRSLAEVATRADRVCVLNILGGESSDVTPVGHAYSGGNPVGDVPVGRVFARDEQMYRDYRPRDSRARTTTTTTASRWPSEAGASGVRVMAASAGPPPTQPPPAYPTRGPAEAAIV